MNIKLTWKKYSEQWLIKNTICIFIKWVRNPLSDWVNCVPNTQCTCSFPHSSCPVVLYLWATGDGGCFIHLVTWRHTFTLALQVFSNSQCMSANSCKSRRATAQACAGQCLSAFQEEKSTEAASQPPASCPASLMGTFPTGNQTHSVTWSKTFRLPTTCLSCAILGKVKDLFLQEDAGKSEMMQP